MTFTAAPPTKQMDGDNNNSNIPTDKYDHISSVPSGVRGSVSSYLQEKKRHTHTQSLRNSRTHAHTQEGNKTGKDAGSTEAGFRTHRQAAEAEQTATQAGKLQWCKWLQRFFPRLPLPSSCCCCRPPLCPPSQLLS